MWGMKLATRTCLPGLLELSQWLVAKSCKGNKDAGTGGWGAVPQGGWAEAPGREEQGGACLQPPDLPGP